MADKPVTVREMIALLSQFDQDTAVYFECGDSYYSGFPDTAVKVEPLYLETDISIQTKGTPKRWERWTTYSQGREILDSRPAVVFNVE